MDARAVTIKKHGGSEVKFAQCGDDSTADICVRDCVLNDHGVCRE